MLLQPLVTLAMVTAVDLLQLSTPPMGLWTEGILAAQLSMPRPLATPDMVQDMPLPPLIPLATVVLLVMLLPHTLEQGMELQASMLQLLAMLPQCQQPTPEQGMELQVSMLQLLAMLPQCQQPTPEQGMELQASMLQLLAMLPQCQLPTVPVPAMVLHPLPQLLPQRMPLAVSQHMVPFPA
jgi:hypothetical protein